MKTKGLGSVRPPFPNAEVQKGAVVKSKKKRSAFAISFFNTLILSISNSCNDLKKHYFTNTNSLQNMHCKQIIQKTLQKTNACSCPKSDSKLRFELVYSFLCGQNNVPYTMFSELTIAQMF